MPETVQIQAISIAALEDFAFSNLFKEIAQRSRVEVLVASLVCFVCLRAPRSVRWNSSYFSTGWGKRGQVHRAMNEAFCGPRPAQAMSRKFRHAHIP